VGVDLKVTPAGSPQAGRLLQSGRIVQDQRV